VIIEMQSCGKQLHDVEPMRRNFEQVVAAQPPVPIEVRRDAVLSGH